MDTFINNVYKTVDGPKQANLNFCQKQFLKIKANT